MLNNIIGEYMSDVKLVWITPESEKHIMYCARVSNPSNQDSNKTGLLNYCVKHGHWSVFEMASMCVEINTTRDISAQMIRHRSFSFQEFSQRYAESYGIDYAEPRRQDLKNRQNSIDDFDIDIKEKFEALQDKVYNTSQHCYELALQLGIAKECARKLLPMNTKTRLYMNGSIRSYIHYLKLRQHESTQLEHREIANQIADIFAENLPTVYNAIKQGV